MIVITIFQVKLEIAQEEIRISRKRQQLEYILPPLSSDEALSLQPIKVTIRELGNFNQIYQGMSSLMTPKRCSVHQLSNFIC